MRAKLRISAYDRDLIGSNDNIGEAVISLTGLCHGGGCTNHRP
jgi:hypothetical protein